MINILEFDENKLAEDEKEIRNITEDIKREAKNLTNEIKNAKLMKLLDSQDNIVNKLSNDYDKLLDICGELLNITNCIEESRRNYTQCEEKISDLLDKIRL